jgi:hypothetical protein
VRVYGGALTISRLQSLRNGGAGLQVDGNSANVTMSDSSLRGNEGDGATVYGGATINFSYNHFGENQNGLEVAGGVGGSATFNNISFNEREGLFLYRKGSSSPTAMFNSNNIFSNAVTEALEVGSANPNLSYSGSACCSVYRTSSTYTAPNGGSVFWVRVSYDERDNTSNAYITGGVRNSANTILWTTSSDVTNQWVDLTASSATQSIHLYVYDTGWGDTQSISSNSAIYGNLSTADLALSGYTHGSEVVNVRGNWWGGSLNPASLISQTRSGYFDYSGFTGQAFTVGPR